MLPHNKAQKGIGGFMAKMIVEETKAAKTGEIDDKVVVAFLAGNQNKIVLDNGKIVPKFRESIRASDEVRVESKKKALAYFETLNSGEKAEIRDVLKPVILASNEKRQERNQVLRAAKSGMFMFRK
jgi:hypothetical protein